MSVCDWVHGLHAIDAVSHAIHIQLRPPIFLLYSCESCQIKLQVFFNLVVFVLIVCIVYL